MHIVTYGQHSIIRFCTKARWPEFLTGASYNIVLKELPPFVMHSSLCTITALNKWLSTSWLQFQKVEYKSISCGQALRLVHNQHAGQPDILQTDSFGLIKPASPPDDACHEWSCS